MRDTERMLSPGYRRYDPGLMRRGEEAGCPLGVAKLVASSPLRIFASQIEHVIACTKIVRGHEACERLVSLVSKHYYTWAEIRRSFEAMTREAGCPLSAVRIIASPRGRLLVSSHQNCWEISAALY
jgi:hypothetical protein